MGINFTHLWAGLVCSVATVAIVVGLLRSCGETVDVRVGEITIVDAGVQP